MNIVQPVIIISAELKGDKNNVRRTQNLSDCLQDIKANFYKAIGVYKGTEEQSFVVLPRHQAEIDTVADFAFKNFGQESVLIQDANQRAYLLYSDGKTEELGVLQEVDSIDGLDAYTVLNGKFYTAIKEQK